MVDNTSLLLQTRFCGFDVTSELFECKLTTLTLSSVCYEVINKVVVFHSCINDEVMLLFVCPKDEQLKLEAECVKHERNLKVLENKLKSHEDDIQAMKSELTQRQEELQVRRVQLRPARIQ